VPDYSIQRSFQSNQIIAIVGISKFRSRRKSINVRNETIMKIGARLLHAKIFPIKSTKKREQN